MLIADNCFCVALLLGLTANDMPCLTHYFKEISGSDTNKHEIRKILYKAAAKVLPTATENALSVTLLRMLGSLQHGRLIWDDVCFFAVQIVGMNITVLSAVDKIEVLQVAHYSAGELLHKMICIGL